MKFRALIFPVFQGLTRQNHKEKKKTIAKIPTAKLPEKKNTVRQNLFEQRTKITKKKTTT